MSKINSSILSNKGNNRPRQLKTIRDLGKTKSLNRNQEANKINLEKEPLKIVNKNKRSH